MKDKQSWKQKMLVEQLFCSQLHHYILRQGFLVGLHVSFQVTPLSETFFTLGTLVRSHPGVLHHVLLEIVLSRET